MIYDLYMIYGVDGQKLCAIWHYFKNVNGSNHRIAHRQFLDNDYIPLGFRTYFRCELLVSGRVWLFGFFPPKVLDPR